MNYSEWIKNGYAVRKDFEGLADRIITDVLVVCKPVLCADGQPHTRKIKALWDTGASSSSIDAQLARELQLIPIGKCVVAHAHGQSVVNRYSFDFIMDNSFGVSLSTASEGIFTRSGFQMLIGMDVIALGDFFIGQCEKDGKPHTYISFSIPSIDRKIDFQEELIAKRKEASSPAYTRQQFSSKKKKKK